MTEPILIVEDDPLQQQMLKTLLRRKLDYGAVVANNGRLALDILDADKSNMIKLIILDYEMPVMDGMETLEILSQRYSSIPVIMLTGSKDIDSMVNVMKMGAADFVTKPYDSERITTTVKNALKMSILSKEVGRLKNEKKCDFGFHNLIGHDAGLVSVVATARKVATSSIPVLITGETGTGKEVFAMAIHSESAQVRKPFIAINCGAIPPQLVESTLFGHEKGSFTGATEKAIGKFREAEGGTIFLDEVGELPLDAQVKLLRVLQEKEVEPVGSSTAVPINVRIISATNRDLGEDVIKGRFREDLFFRLNVLQLALPALRDRKDDVIALAEHFIDRFCINEGGLPKALSREVQFALIAHDWPGNVRQLENTISRAMVMNDKSTLEISDFSDLFPKGNIIKTPEKSEASHSNSYSIRMVSSEGVFKTIQEVEDEAINLALRYFNNNITRSAKGLGIAKSTFYKKIK
ncbi:MAG: sigma-54-dependent transcriptional regulator [Alphaproteobacteria bacterium]